MQIHEIFSSIQGEGMFAGTPALFIRLYGCNLCCPFCDTFQVDFEEMSVTDLVTTIHTQKHKTIIWTGGEPTLQQEEILEVVSHASPYLKHHIETNGTNKIINPAAYEHITISPKGSLGQFERDAPELQKIHEKHHNLEIKWVTTTAAGAVPFYDRCRYHRIPSSVMRITEEDEIPITTIRKDREFIKDCLWHNLKFSPRLQKIYGLR